MVAHPLFRIDSETSQRSFLSHIHTHDGKIFYFVWPGSFELLLPFFAPPLLRSLFFSRPSSWHLINLGSPLQQGTTLRDGIKKFNSLFCLSSKNGFIHIRIYIIKYEKDIRRRRKKNSNKKKEERYKPV